MTTGFQQQERGLGVCFPRQAASPQHGQKAPKKPLSTPPPRSNLPRPGH
ncbi:MAG: hypothetical protein JNL41_15230 [Phenylobacterium sp.]|nr:hypothetical protein [Phenylobacterium sp.]MBL8555624.1 hypothetical protein [Phenylobacterium sp.]